jgi:3-hydroxy-9,10-secoandrosta-1,3,5(10)-triene-9,17-dione monooxygenase reductase component
MSFDDGVSRIGGSDPFATPLEERDPVRRLRARLMAPVTVWTAYNNAERPAGITISSVLVAEGDSPEVLGLVDPLSALWSAIEETSRFIVHVLAADQVRVAEKFALRIPGNPFEGEELIATEWGPALRAVTTRVACSLVSSTEAGYALLVRARLAEFVLDESNARPLAYYRGDYFTAGPRGE